MTDRRRQPAIEGWFTLDDEPSLLGNKCTTCGTVFFPKASFFCRNPACAGEEFEETKLSRRGRVWSYTDAQYQPPPPYIPRAGEHTPFAIAAVELVIEQLFGDDDTDYVVYKWKPVTGATS